MCAGCMTCPGAHQEQSGNPHSSAMCPRGMSVLVSIHGHILDANNSHVMCDGVWHMLCQPRSVIFIWGATSKSHAGGCRRRALAVIAASATPDVAAIQLADIPSAHPLAVDVRQASGTTPLSTPQSAHDLDSSAAVISMPPADRAGQQPLPAPQDVQDSSSGQQPQQAQDGVLAAPSNAADAAGAPDAAPTSALQPVWLRQKTDEPAPKPAPSPQAAGKRGFWGAIGAYITGADQRQTT